MTFSVQSEVNNKAATDEFFDEELFDAATVHNNLNRDLEGNQE